jgi:hypothetical protein
MGGHNFRANNAYGESYPCCLTPQPLLTRLCPHHSTRATLVKSTMSSFLLFYLVALGFELRAWNFEGSQSFYRLGHTSSPTMAS